MEDDDSFEVIQMDEEEAKQLQQNYEESITKNMNIQKAYQIENWYPQLKQFTFITEFLDLTIEEAQLILDLYDKKNISQNQQKIQQNLIEKIEIARKKLPSDHFFIRLSTRSPKDVSYDFMNPQRKQATVVALKQKLKEMKINQKELEKRKKLLEQNSNSQVDDDDDQINQNSVIQIRQESELRKNQNNKNSNNNLDSGSNYLSEQKLDSLSGHNKKSLDLQQDFGLNQLQHQLNSQENIEQNEQSFLDLITNDEANEIFQFIQNFSKQFLKLNNSQDALQILIQSDRIVEDLQNLIIQRNKNNQNTDPKQKLCDLCLREWRDFTWQDEFRCFFYNGQLNAISQYEEDTYTPALNQAPLQQAIANTISAAFKQLKPHLPFQKGVIDFIILKKDELYMLEVNPFQDYSGSGTRGSMFSWQQDMEVLMNGPLQFRVLSYVKNNICNQWLPNYGTPSKTGAHLVLIQAIKEILENKN